MVTHSLPPASFFLLMESGVACVLRIFKVSILSLTAARVASISSSISNSSRSSDNASKGLVEGEVETFDFFLVCGVPGGGRGGVRHANCRGVFFDRR